MGRLLRAGTDAVRRLLPAAVRGSVTGVHRARVASRRLRELLPVVAVAAGRDARAARRWLRHLTRTLGGVRELDVTRALLAAEARRWGWPAAPVARVDRGLARERAEQRRHLVARVRRLDAAPGLAALDALAADVEAADDLAPAAAALGSRVHRRARKLAEAIDAAGTLYEPDALHAVRIAGKKLRYALEVAHGAARLPLAAEVRQLKALQDLLGGLHDRQVLQHRLQAAMAAPRADRASVVRLEAWVARLERECRNRHARFVRRAPRLRDLAVRAAVETPLALVPARPGRMGVADATGVRDRARRAGRARS
ncbi:MAG: CHAD domain-containing protein [Vicinamibacterales bacterium]